MPDLLWAPRQRPPQRPRCEPKVARDASLFHGFRNNCRSAFLQTRGNGIGNSCHPPATFGGTYTLGTINMRRMPQLTPLRSVKFSNDMLFLLRRIGKVKNSRGDAANCRIGLMEKLPGGYSAGLSNTVTRSPTR